MTVPCGFIKIMCDGLKASGVSMRQFSEKQHFGISLWVAAASSAELIDVCHNNIETTTCHSPSSGTATVLSLFEGSSSHAPPRTFDWEIKALQSQCNKEVFAGRRMAVNIQAVAGRNNLGVSCIDSGDVQSALDHFSAALKYTMGDLDAIDGGGQDDLNKPCNFLVTLPSEADANLHAKPAIVSRRSNGVATPVSLPFVYTRGINVIPCAGAYSSDPLINMTIMSSIIIFNISIVYHLKGLEEESSGRFRLSKAKSLYEKSRRLLSHAGVPLNATGNPVIDVLSMALYNNLAHVSFELRLFVESRNCFDRLIRFALTVVPLRYGDHYVATLLDQQKSNFLLNAIILQPPRLAAAA